MAPTLDWKPDPYQPHNVVHAHGGGTTYRITSWPPSMTSTGAITAVAGDHELGRFPYTPQGKRAAQTACESHAAFVGDSRHARAEVVHAETTHARLLHGESVHDEIVQNHGANGAEAAAQSS